MPDRWPIVPVMRQPARVHQCALHGFPDAVIREGFEHPSALPHARQIPSRQSHSGGYLGASRRAPRNARSPHGDCPWSDDGSAISCRHRVLPHAGHRENRHEPRRLVSLHRRRCHDQHHCALMTRCLSCCLVWNLLWNPCENSRCRQHARHLPLFRAKHRISRACGGIESGVACDPTAAFPALPPVSGRTDPVDQKRTHFGRCRPLRPVSCLGEQASCADCHHPSQSYGRESGRSSPKD